MQYEDDISKILSDGDNREASIEDIIAQDEKDNAEENKVLMKDVKKSKNKKIALIVSGSVLTAALVTGVLLFNPFDENKTFFGGDGDKGVHQAPVEEVKKPAEEVKTEKKDDGEIKDDESFSEGELTYPIKTEDWERITYDQTPAKDRKANILKIYADSEMTSSANILPSEESGYTSDDSKQMLEDDTINPFYSYWTAENYQSTVGEMMERLINPSYGGWGTYQYSGYSGKDKFNMNLVKDMFTDDWQSRNSSKLASEYIPVFADWEGNDYGLEGTLLSNTRWIGEVESTESEFIYNDETLHYNVNLVAKIKYTAWAKDQSKLEKTATLTLKLVPNAGNEQNGNTSYKVLIDDASLKVDG